MSKLEMLTPENSMLTLIDYQPETQTHALPAIVPGHNQPHIIGS
jgi:hypothetical protein